MINLLALVVVIGLAIAFYVWRRSSLPHARTDALIFACLYCLGLGLALRFGGRTYPGLYFPNSTFLNGLLNNTPFLFTGIGYLAVVVAGAADGVLIFTRTVAWSPAKALKALKWIAVSLAAAIALFGFYWAAVLQRLPN